MKKILIFIVVLVATSLISGIAYSKANGTISGRVTDGSGNGIADVYVGAYDPNDAHWINGSYTAGDGNCSLNVPAGTYWVRFRQSPSDGYYAPEWYDNKSNPATTDLVTVKGSQTTSNINAQLEMGGTISGRVTDSSGNAIANVEIGAPDLYGHWMPGSSTDNNGNYSFNMPAGTYKVHFNPSSSSGYYAPEWYGNKGNVDVADLVTVNAGKTTSNINAQLKTGGTISGRVTDPSRKGTARVYVSAVDPDSWYWIDGSYPDSNGNYIFNVPAGTYKVFFSPARSGKSAISYYAPEWYDNRSNFQAADLVTVNALQTTFNINARLEFGGTISGRVTDSAGNGIGDVYVEAFDRDNGNIVLNGARTNSKGVYTIPLTAGNYKVRVSPGPDFGNYAAEWYSNKSDFQSADTVTVKRFNNSTIY